MRPVSAAREHLEAEQVTTKVQCPECGRVFDLSNDVDAGEWAYGHDCEEGAE